MTIIPTPAELARAPELAILTTLDIVLELAIHALVARHPELEDPDQREWLMPPPASAPLGAVVVGLADTLRCAVLHYMSSIESEHDSSAPEAHHVA
jgi:hypothetical protein